MYEWQQKFTKQVIEAYIAKKEGRNHQYISELALSRTNVVKHSSKDSFYASYRRNL